jgi:hypothetical protein
LEENLEDTPKPDIGLWIQKQKDYPMPQFFSTFKRKVPFQSLLLALILILTFVLVSPDLLPTMPEINPHDETKYIASGWELINGDVREIARGPLLGFVYGSIFMIVGKSVDWFMLSAGIGRMVLYVILWLSVIRLGSRFKHEFSPLITAGLLLISTAPIAVLNNPSDALFTAMSAFALSFVLDYYHARHARSIWIASLFLGLASVSRPDGVFLFPFFVIAIMLIIRSGKQIWRSLPAVFLPAAGVFMAFFLLHGLTTGDYSTQIGSKGYNTLEWAQHMISGTSFEEGFEQAVELYGTRTDNEGSVFRAILRNPGAFINRIFHNMKILPGMILTAYGKKVGPAVFILALLGIFALIKKRSFMLIAILILWPLYGALYLGFYIRAGFLLLSQFIWFLLASYGVEYFFTWSRKASARLVASVLLLALIAYSMLDSKPAFLAVAVVLLFIAGFIWIADFYVSLDSNQLSIVGLLIALCGGIILHDDFPFPLPWEVGESSQEVAVHYLADNLAPGSVVASYAPLPAIASKMTWTDLARVPGGSDLSAFQAWLEENDVSALVVEPDFIQSHQADWALIEEGIDRSIRLELVSDPGSIQVFFVQE